MLYDIQNFKKIEDNHNIWDKAKIKGELKLDQKFMKTFI